MSPSSYERRTPLWPAQAHRKPGGTLRDEVGGRQAEERNDRDHMAGEYRIPTAHQRVVGDGKQRHQQAPAWISEDQQQHACDAGDEDGSAYTIAESRRRVIHPAASEVNPMAVRQMLRVRCDVGDETLEVEH